MNKKLALTIALASIVSCVWAGENAASDSININNAKNVKIIEKDGKMTVEVKGADGNPDYTYSRTVSNTGETIVSEENRNIGFRIPFIDRDTDSRDVVKARRTHGEFCLNLGGFGWIYATDKPGDLKTKANHSFEFSLDHLINYKFYPQGSRRTNFMLGVGMQWRRIALDNMRWNRDDDTRNVSYGPWDEKYYDRKSSLNTYSLTLPLMIIQPLGKDWRLSAGAKACFNVGANAHSEYRYDDIRYTDTFSHLHQRPVTVELTGALTWEGIGLYVNYAPCNTFKDGRGPKLNTFTIGIALAY